MTLRQDEENNGGVDMGDDDDVHEHDQLPSVEEYRSSLDRGSHRIDPSRFTASLNDDDEEDDDIIYDDDDNENYHVNDDLEEVWASINEEDDDGDVDVDVDLQDYSIRHHEENHHDQLPSVDEIHAMRMGRRGVGSGDDSNDGVKKWKRCCAYFLCVITLILVICLPILVAVEDDEIKQERIVEMKKLLIEKKLATLDALSDPNGPQSMAVEFLVQEEQQYGRIHDLTESSLSSSTDKFIERYVLAVFYFATTSNPDKDWKYDMNFLSVNDVCEWNSKFWNLNTGRIISHGVLCNNDVDPPRVTSLEIRK